MADKKCDVYCTADGTGVRLQCGTHGMIKKFLDTEWRGKNVAYYNAALKYESEKHKDEYK